MTEPHQIAPVLAGTSPATRYVYTIVVMDGPITQAGIRSLTSLSDNTVQAALNRLEERGTVERQVHTDARGPLWTTESS